MNWFLNDLLIISRAFSFFLLNFKPDSIKAFKVLNRGYRVLLDLLPIVPSHYLFRCIYFTTSWPGIAYKKSRQSRIGFMPLSRKGCCYLHPKKGRGVRTMFAYESGNTITLLGKKTMIWTSMWRTSSKNFEWNEAIRFFIGLV